MEGREKELVGYDGARNGNARKNVALCGLVWGDLGVYCLYHTFLENSFHEQHLSRIVCFYLEQFISYNSLKFTKVKIKKLATKCNAAYLAE